MDGGTADDTCTLTHDEIGCTAPLWTAGGVFHTPDGVTRCTTCHHPIYSDAEQKEQEAYYGSI